MRQQQGRDHLTRSQLQLTYEESDQEVADEIDANDIPRCHLSPLFVTLIAMEVLLQRKITSTVFVSVYFSGRSLQLPTGDDHQGRLSCADTAPTTNSQAGVCVTCPH